mmetsp:Transcript_4090/g.7552  ORF Transcript_4090/g.7552 Transcript_4090/m.7552 type:complete len:226 (+) Transcript_4090:105-782(+)
MASGVLGESSVSAGRMAPYNGFVKQNRRSSSWTSCPTRSVSFGEKTIRVFRSNSMICQPNVGSGTSPSALRSRAVSRGSVSKYSSSTESMEEVEAETLRGAVKTVVQEKIRDIWSLFTKGELMVIEDLKSQQSRWMSTLYYLNVVTSSYKNYLEGCSIHKRGFVVKQILTKSPRTLDHEKYINSLVDFIYRQLSPKLRMKTDLEWLEWRISIQKRTIRTKISHAQ